MILQSERFPNARELAGSCEVSRRTVHRDLELLAAADVPVRYRPERQGYHLARGFFLPPTNLTESEALGLNVLARQWKSDDALGLLRHASQGAVKLVEMLPDEIRERVLAASEAFQAADRPAAPGSATQKAVRDVLLDALRRRRQLRIRYQDSDTLEQQTTKLGVYRVLIHDRHWFLVGRSSLHRRVVVIGEPWIQRVEVTEDESVVPPRFSLERFLGDAWGVKRGAVRYDVRLRFAARVAPLLLEASWHPSQRSERLADGRAELTFVVDGLDEILTWVLSHGDSVEVIGPDELRARVHAVARRMAEAHEPGRTPTP